MSILTRPHSHFNSSVFNGGLVLLAHGGVLGEVVWQACELLLIVLYLLFHFLNFYCFSRCIPVAFNDRGACWEMRTRCVVRCEKGEGVSIVHCVLTEQGPEISVLWVYKPLCFSHPPTPTPLLYFTAASVTTLTYLKTPQSLSTTWEYIAYLVFSTLNLCLYNPSPTECGRSALP